MTMVGSRVFLDTNILVYPSARTSPFHAQALRAITSREQADLELWISRQVLREYLATVTRSALSSPRITLAMIVAEVQSFEERFRVGDENRDITTRLLDLLVQHPMGGRQVHDANIVATMLAYGIDQILTHNVADFKRFSHLITILPLGAA
ncbi:MAG: type II toxin-antitoxin system VapC family toxin [Chloroflexota bacterium]|nr:type II toxin-antitoxin system VapC family toxin [Chloroflexota bacterium]